ncbi:MAG: M23 family metallopeptidase [Pseudomonadota bacterium]
MIHPSQFAPDAPFISRLILMRLRIYGLLARWVHWPVRYFVTRDGAIRLRYICLLAVFAVLFGSFGAWTIPNNHFSQSVSKEMIANLADQLLKPSAYRLRYAKTSDLPQIASIDEKIMLSAPVQKVLEVGRGETLSEVLQDAGIPAETANQIVAAMAPLKSPREIKAGQNMQLVLMPRSGRYDFDTLSMAIDPISTLHVRRGADGKLASRMDVLPLTKTVQAARVSIRNSVYGSAAAAGVPSRIVAATIKNLSHGVDLQRDIKSGDTIELLYEVSVTPDGRVIESGDLLMARVNLAKRQVAMYRYEARDGTVSYFRPDGLTTRGTLLRTPVDGARMTSGFGMRRHPILGYSKMHKGVDFGASTGTPVYAAGNGVIEKASWFNAYGNYIRIRHTASMKTAYAHLSRYAKGIKPGVAVKQGQVIGYVGTTGRSTGPHLHYEILVNNKQVNPASYKSPVSPGLEAAEAKRFKDHVGKTDTLFFDAMASVKEASATQDATETAPVKTDL